MFTFETSTEKVFIYSWGWFPVFSLFGLAMTSIFGLSFCERMTADATTNIFSSENSFLQERRFINHFIVIRGEYASACEH